MQVHIDRGGERYGPYSIEDINAFLANGTLLPTDLAWQEGMTDWVPISQILGVVMPGAGAEPPPPATGATCPQCQAPVEVNQVVCMGCGTRLSEVAASRGVRPVNSAVEERQKSKWVLTIGILLCVAFVMPVYKVTGDVVFESFRFKGKKTLDVFMQIMPLIVGATMCGIAFTTQAIARSIVLLSLGGLYLIVEMANRGSGVPVGSSIHIFLIVVGWTSFFMGALSRYYRPDSLTAFILATVGGAFLCLFWLIPLEGVGRSGGMMLVNAFRMFDQSVPIAIGMVVMLGLMIAGSVMCFINTPSQPVAKVQKLARLAIIFMFSSLAAMALMAILAPLLSSGDIGAEPRLKMMLFILTNILHGLLATFGLIMVLPLGGMDIFVGRADR